MIRKLLALALLLIGTGWAITAGYMLFAREPDPIPGAAAIVVLSGPVRLDGSLEEETLARVSRGVALWQDGLAPRIVMSGGPPEEGLPAAAALMRDAAIAAGVPPEAIAVETGSHSTLQNALLTAAVEPPADGPILLVTHRYHLPRAWLNFHFAGYDIAALVGADQGPATLGEGLLWEGLKWPVNIVRIVGTRAAMALGVPTDRYMPWLQ